jgi:hypothetical protein
VKIELQNKTNMSIYQGMMLKIISSLFQWDQIRWK